MAWSFRITSNDSTSQLAWVANIVNGSFSFDGRWTVSYRIPIFSNIVGCKVAHFRKLSISGGTSHTRRNISGLGYTWYQAYQEWRGRYNIANADLIIVNPTDTDKIALILADGISNVNVTSTVFENNNCQYLNSDSSFNSLISLINTTISSESSATYSGSRNKSNYPVTRAASVINAAKNTRAYMLLYNNLMPLTLSVNSTPQDTATTIKNNATSYWNTIKASVNSGWEHYTTANNKYNEIIAGYNAIVSRDTRLLDHADKSELNSARSSLLFNYNKTYNDGFADYNSVKTILDKNKIIIN